MKKLVSILLLAVVLMLSSCGVYKKYPGTASDDTAADSLRLPQWREFFEDPCLRDLIDSALAGNTALAVAALRLRQADETLKASKLAYIPSVYFAPNGGLSLSNGTRSASFQLPLTLDWSFGSPGTLFARKHQAQARRIQAQDNYNAILNELISQIAVDYYMLQLLDDQVEILENTISFWERTLEIQREYLLSGKAFYASVAQMESKILDAQQDLLQAEADIAVWEKTICLLMAKPCSGIRRSRSQSYPAPQLLETGVDLGILRRRPDIRAAERDLEITYYITSEAKSAFYPEIRLTGDIGWPALVSAALSLIQPVFAGGALKSRLNISKMDQEIARLQFNQSLFQAATEVSQALADYKLHMAKEELYSRQEEIQIKAYRVVEEMSRDGKANYLEIIRAQEKLLSAQMNKLQSRYNANESSIRLYKALGM